MSAEKVIYPITLNLFAYFPAYVMCKTLLNLIPKIIKHLRFYVATEVLLTSNH
jgi:hypothetical protein